jgi:hypothetical protein
MSEHRSQQETAEIAAARPSRWPGRSLAISIGALLAVGLFPLGLVIEAIFAAANSAEPVIGSQDALSGLLLGTVGCFALAHAVYRRQRGVDRLIGWLALVVAVGPIATTLFLLTYPYGFYGVVSVIVVGAPIIGALVVAYRGASAGRDRLIERGPRLPIAQIALVLSGALIVPVVIDSFLSLDGMITAATAVSMFSRGVATCVVGALVARRLNSSRPFALRLAVALVVVGSIAAAAASVGSLLSVVFSDAEGALAIPALALPLSLISGSLWAIETLGAGQMADPISNVVYSLNSVSGDLHWLVSYLFSVGVAIALLFVDLLLARAIYRGSRRALIAMIVIAALTIPAGVATSYGLSLGPDYYYRAESIALIIRDSALQILLIALLLLSRRSIRSAS